MVELQRIDCAESVGAGKAWRLRPGGVACAAPVTDSAFAEWFEGVWGDREDRVYKSLFGDLGAGGSTAGDSVFQRFGKEPHPGWRNHGVFACPPHGQRTTWAYVTSGLSNPWNLDQPGKDPSGFSGVGFELLLESPVAADYAVPLSSSIDLTLHGDMVHKSKQYFTAYNDTVFPFSLGVTPGFEEYNARIGLSFEGGKYNLGLWGKNLSDNDTLAGIGIETNTNLRFGTVPYPRRYGVDFQAKF